MGKQLVIIGASGHGKVVADIARKNGYDEILFLDDNVNCTACGNDPVIGGSDRYRDFDCDMVVAIGNAKVRQRLQEKLEAAGKSVVVLIHPDAVIADDVTIGAGTVVMAGAVINSASIIGKGCIINTCASVDHDCVAAHYVHISVGAHLAGTVTVGARTWIGIGAVVSNNLTITADCMVGAGAVVVRDLTERGVYKGVPAMTDQQKKHRGGGNTC